MKKFLLFLVLTFLLASCQVSFSVQSPKDFSSFLNTPTPVVGPLEATPVLPTPTQVPGQPRLSTLSITPVPTIAPSTVNNFYGIPSDAPTWLIIPRDSNHPFNTLILGVDEKCSLTINTQTNLQDLTVTTDQLVLGRHTWQRTQAFQGNQQVNEIYVPDIYPPEYTEAAGTNGFGYSLNGFYESCRVAIQGILAGMQ